MAMSLVDESLASVPMPELQAIEEHLLHFDDKGRLELSIPQTPPPRRPQASSLERDHDCASSFRSHQSCDIEVAESVHVSCELPPTRAPPPQLTPSRSAPEARLAAMVDHTTSQEAVAKMVRAATFQGFSGGDTQPMESQVYRDFTKSMAHPMTTTPKKPVSDFYVSPNARDGTYDTTATDRTPRTVVEGEMGFVDLESAFKPYHSQDAASTTSEYEEIMPSPQSQEVVKEGSVVYAFPETPALAGHKRRRSGEMLTSGITTTKRTPGISQAFGNAFRMPALSATQLFDQTQAPSSPMHDAPRSDPVLTRPSPNLHTVGVRSSPTFTNSSPVILQHNPPPSTAGEPRNTYTSMRESQERRAARLRQELGRGRSITDDADDDEEEDPKDSADRRLERSRFRKIMSDHTTNEWSKFRAPPRPGSRSLSNRNSNRTATIDLVTPATVRVDRGRNVDVSEDAHETDDELLDQDEGEPISVEVMDPKADNDLEEDGSDDYDEYDELGQTVLRSQADPPDEMDDLPGADSSSENGRAPDDDRSLKDDEHVVVLEASNTKAAPITQSTAIADSQPERHRALRSLLDGQDREAPVSSFVPGSQYVGTTSQELARQSNAALRSSSAPGRPEPIPQTDHEYTKIPSSPPIMSRSDGMQNVTMDHSSGRLQTYAHPQPDSEARNVHPLIHGPEIPESDLPDPDSDSRNAAEAPNREPEVASLSAPTFATAPTHLTETGISYPRSQLGKFSASQQSVPSPLKAAGVRRFTDIAADPSPPDADNEGSLDVDAIMSDVMTRDDQQFLDVVTSPPKKRVRRLPPRTAISREVTFADDAEAGLTNDSLEEVAQLDNATHKITQTAITAELNSVSSEMPDAPSRSLRSSPNKGNVLLPASPDKTNPPTGTPDSVRKRERAGAEAASQLLTARLCKVAKNSQLRKSDDRSAVSKRKKTKGKPKGKASLSAKNTTTDQEVQIQVFEPADPQEDISVEAVDFVEAVNANAVNDDTTPTAPMRVFALFKGKYFAWYPATVLNAAPDGKGFSVRFDDSTVTTIESKDLCSLDLHIDDSVKVDLPQLRNKTWLVKGFGPNRAKDECDIYGHTSIQLRAKPSHRDSLSKTAATSGAEEKTIEVQIANVYLTHTMFPRISDRTFIPPEAFISVPPRSATPSTGLQTPDVETPTSRSRRQTAKAAANASVSIIKVPEEPAIAPSVAQGGGIFSNMAFAISYIGNDAEKLEVTRMVTDNGGTVLHQGFDELFVSSHLDKLLTPSKRPISNERQVTGIEDTEEIGGLQLRAELQTFGFVALIADRYSRRVKYMQALALGLPTLSGRWVMDSLHPQKNPGLAEKGSSTVLPWTKYVLPAGESRYLSGAVRSRYLQPYDPNACQLVELIASRSMLLQGDGVLIVLPKKDKRTWARHKPYAFLTLALGAGCVRCVTDMSEARSLIDRDLDKWKWVYVEGSVSAAASTLFSQQAGLGGKKKKQAEDGQRADNGPVLSVSNADDKVTVVNDEFVIQSLILGDLYN